MIFRPTIIRRYADADDMLLDMCAHSPPIDLKPGAIAYAYVYDHIRSKSHARYLVRQRKEIAAKMRSAGFTLEEIGWAFCRHHTTVLNWLGDEKWKARKKETQVQSSLKQHLRLRGEFIDVKRS